jgi:hypothetical protein
MSPFALLVGGKPFSVGKTGEEKTPKKKAGVSHSIGWEGDSHPQGKEIGEGEFHDQGDNVRKEYY